MKGDNKNGPKPFYFDRHGHCRGHTQTSQIECFSRIIMHTYIRDVMKVSNCLLFLNISVISKILATVSSAGLFHFRLVCKAMEFSVLALYRSVANSICVLIFFFVTQRVFDLLYCFSKCIRRTKINCTSFC